MKLNAAYIFVAPGADYKEHNSLVSTPGVDLYAIGVSTYSEGVEVAKKLVEEKGIKAIELCAGFGNEGTALVAKALRGKASVGSVKFDHHPGLEFKSGDELFNK